MGEETITFLGLLPAMALVVVLALWIIKEGVIYGFYNRVYESFGISIGRYFTFGVYKLAPDEQNIIYNRIKYYRLLNAFDKKQFNHRVKKFIKNKKFVGREGVVVTEDMQLLIAAKAIMLSFGFGKYELYDFHTILVYPQEYYSRITKKYHKGEVNARGIIVLSWQHFVEGIEDETDNLNLGLHEFAHAYLHEAKSIGHSDEVYGEPTMTHNISSLHLLFANDHHTEQLKSINAVRNYAFTNVAEFFSVACEYFFETPQTFKRNAPLLYNLIKNMLNQDTVKIGLED